VLVGAFRGWNDGAQGASLATSFLAQAWEARRFANIDPEEFYDFQATRPHVALEDGITRRIDWPETVFYHAPIPGIDRDAVLMLGIEPNLRWRTFSDEIVELAGELDVELVVTLGALLADVPHTRPAPVTGSASDQKLVEELGLAASRYEGPTGIVGVLQAACQEAGMPTASLWASVPHYVAAAPNPKAALALVRKLESLLGVAVDATELVTASVEYERQVSLAVQSDPDVQAFVERLEQAAEEDAAAEELSDPTNLPSGDVLAREFQRFLRQRGPEDAT
jgi:predicted ATP-grasp superfamily ATP-dependent carboligase